MTAKNRIAKYLWMFIKYFSLILAGICCQDLTGFGKAADFDWFSYKNV